MKIDGQCAIILFFYMIMYGKLEFSLWKVFTKYQTITEYMEIFVWKEITYCIILKLSKRNFIWKEWSFLLNFAGNCFSWFKVDIPIYKHQI